MEARQCWRLVFDLSKSWRSARLIRERKSGTEERNMRKRTGQI